MPKIREIAVVTVSEETKKCTSCKNAYSLITVYLAKRQAKKDMKRAKFSKS